MTTITADLNSPRALEMLADSIQRDMDDELSRFVGHDRGVALSLLAWLGLRYYSKVHPDQHLDLQLLQRLIGKNLVLSTFDMPLTCAGGVREICSRDPQGGCPRPASTALRQPRAQRPS